MMTLTLKDRTWDRVGSVSPQTNPELFTVEQLQLEIKYLRGLNKRHGEHTLRTLAIVKLQNEINAR